MSLLKHRQRILKTEVAQHNPSSKLKNIVAEHLPINLDNTGILYAEEKSVPTYVTLSSYCGVCTLLSVLFYNKSIVGLCFHKREFLNFKLRNNAVTLMCYDF